MFNRKLCSLLNKKPSGQDAHARQMHIPKGDGHGLPGRECPPGGRRKNRSENSKGAAAMYKILIIEDDLAMAQAIQREMKAWGNEAEYLEDFQNVLAEFAEYDPHLVLMDITLPFYNGYHWCSEIRKVSSVPVIFISSAADNMNIIMAMNMGGDDFIAKPFDLSVLTAKVQAVLRRTYDLSGRVPMLEHRGAILNLYDTTLSYEGEKISLTKNEFRILQTLMENKGRLVSRDTLMTKLWETDDYIEENTLTVNIARLRRKLEHAGLKDFITTKVGEGYLIENEDHGGQQGRRR